MPWEPSRVVKDMDPRPPAPQAPRAGVPGGLWVLLARDMGARLGPPWTRCKIAPNPRHLGTFRGPQEAPGPFPSRLRLGASGGPQGTLGNPCRASARISN